MSSKEKITEILKAYTKKHNIMASSVILEEYAEELLANDVVKVVRCKDCKYFKKTMTSGTENPTMCELDTKFRRPYDFCSYGELKELGK